MYQRNYYQNKQSASGRRVPKKILLSLFAIFLVFILFYSVDMFIYRGKIYPNILAMSQDIGRKNPEQARQQLQPVAERMISRSIVIKHENQEINVIPSKDLGASIDVEALVQKAYSIARNGNLWNRLRDRSNLFRKEYQLSDFLFFNKTSFEDFNSNLQSQFEQVPENAVLDSGRIIPARIGLTIDRQELLFNIHQNMIDSVNTDRSQVIQVPVQLHQPEVTTSELLAQIGVKQPISTYETSLRDKEENTLYNIQKAAHQINGILLKPGEDFSFNRLIGTADQEDGYKKSTIIANGQFVSGYGGGVCQVSTTLYNAALLANLEIIERYNHSIYGDATNYVPLGRDAAIFYGYKDLKFRNSLEQQIAIFCEMKQDDLVVTMMGERSLDKVIKIISQDEKVHDYDVIEMKDENGTNSTNKVLQEGIPGYSIKTYRVIVDSDGEKIEFLSNDLYASVPRKVVVD